MNEEGENAGLVHARSMKSFTTTCKVLSIFCGVSLLMFLLGVGVGEVIMTPAAPAGQAVSPPSVGESARVPPSIESKQNQDSTATIDTASLVEARKLAQAKLRELEDYYGTYADKVLYSSPGLEYGFTGPNKEPVNPDSFNKHVNLVAHALVHKESLKIGFIGSSVMCGHDNCYYDSFPSQMERFTAPVFQKAGVGLEMRNACQGGR